MEKLLFTISALFTFLIGSTQLPYQLFFFQPSTTEYSFSYINPSPLEFREAIHIDYSGVRFERLSTYFPATDCDYIVGTNNNGGGDIERMSVATLFGHLTSTIVNTAIGYTPYNGSTNPNGYISSYTETDPLFNTKFSGKTTADLAESTNLYFTDARARTSISVTNIGTSGTATYNSSTGVFNIPNYTSSSGTVTSVGVASTDLTVSGSPITSSGNITLNLSNTGVSPGTYDWVTVDAKGRATAGANSPIPTIIASGARNFNQAYQLSSTRPAFISISPCISCALSLSGGQAGNVQLQISPNGSSGWISVATMPASNTGTLTIGLNTVQTSGAQLDVALPAGYYWRAVTTNTTGTPTYTFNGGYELVY